jgi:hypothetical protein
MGCQFLVVNLQFVVFGLQFLVWLEAGLPDP